LDFSADELVASPFLFCLKRVLTQLWNFKAVLCDGLQDWAVFCSGMINH